MTPEILSIEIKRLFPNLVVQNIRLLGEGWTSRVFLVNDEIVFKVPIDESLIRSVQREAIVLDSLQNRLSIPTPRLLYQGVMSNGLPIIGETLIPGKTLNEHTFKNLPPAAQTKILIQLGKVLNELHSFSPQSELIRTYDKAANILFWHDSYSDAVKSLFTKEEQVLIESLLRAFEKIEQADIVPVFAHGDLHFENLLYDPASNKLTGMIDFGGASYVDPYYDLRYFWDCGIETIADAAGIQLTENVWTRILFHHLCNEFDSLVCHIKRNKDYTDELQYTKKIIALLCHFY